LAPVVDGRKTAGLGMRSLARTAIRTRNVLGVLPAGQALAAPKGAAAAIQANDPDKDGTLD
jgi:hypothetical protein